MSSSQKETLYFVVLVMFRVDVLLASEFSVSSSPKETSFFAVLFVCYSSRRSSSCERVHRELFSKGDFTFCRFLFHFEVLELIPSEALHYEVFVEDTSFVRVFSMKTL